MYDFKVPDLLGIVAYYTKDNRIGRNHVIKALRIRPNDARLLKNLKFFNRRMGRDDGDKFQVDTFESSHDVNKFLHASMRPFSSFF